MMRTLAGSATGAALLFHAVAWPGAAGPAGAVDPMVTASGGYDPLARPHVGYDPLAPAAPGPGSADPGETELAPEFGNLPRGDGAALVFGLCSGCHALDIVKQQRMSDARWDYTLDWMVAEQGMPPLPDPLREQVLAYLTTHFSSER